MNGLDLFSGIGGNTLGLRQYIKTVAYCEADRHAQSVLLSRMGSSDIEYAPIWDDITTLKGSMFDVPIDIILGGFPCQDISIAGNGKGLEGERSGLFYEVCRLVEEIKPTFVFLENVPAIRTRGLREVVRELTNLGYDCRWTCVSAREVGAPHLRKRWFLLARNSHGEGLESRNSESSVLKGEDTHARRICSSMADTYDERLEGWKETGDSESQGALTFEHTKRHAYLSGRYWATEPDVGRVVDGCPIRVDRIKRLGNGVVPLQAKTAFERLMGIET